MRTGSLILAVFLAVSPVAADEYRYAVGGGGGLISMSGGDFFSFDNEKSFGFSLGHRLSHRWQLDLDYTAFTFVNDPGAELADSAGGLYNNSPLDFKASRVGFRLDRRLFGPDRFINLTTGFGGGLLVWKAVNPDSHTTYTVRSSKNETTDFSAGELYLSGAIGIVVRLQPRFSLHLVGHADYLTGAGAEFETAIKNVRDPLLLGLAARLYFHFGAIKTEGWRSEQAWITADNRPAEPRQLRRDSDGDGVDDAADKCLNTPRGADVDAVGCPIDSDRDGVPDGLDDCPGTLGEARNEVDIHGCPVDSDYDGVSDYTDRCPSGPIGAQVDERGCPIDTDKDGVPDGLDDCPYTLPEVEVDRNGCIDLSMLAQPMVLDIDYAPGSFEVDPHNRTRIESLARLLNFVPDIRLDINGYTDDIGGEAANRALSEKRANRVKGILVSLGVEAERIKSYGKGETNFVASNQTADGRARNRRIEIVFYK